MVAGLYANVAQSGLSVICSGAEQAEQAECDISLPPLPADGTEEYILESYTHSSPSPDATAARFLEQATFGPTRYDIDMLVDGGLDFTSWVDEQMTMEGSSLREFYRRRVNPKFENSFKVGVSVVLVLICMCCVYVVEGMILWGRYILYGDAIVLLGMDLISCSFPPLFLPSFSLCRLSEQDLARSTAVGGCMR